MNAMRDDAGSHMPSRADDPSPLRFFRSLDRVNRAIQGTSDIERMLSDVLEVVLSVFETDRAWILYPCDPGSPTWRVSMERTRPEHPGAGAMGVDLPTDADLATLFRVALASQGPFTSGPTGDLPLPLVTREVFGVKSGLAMAVYPKDDRPSLFGIHQCTHAREWMPEDKQIFQEIGRRLGDGLTTLLAVRRLRESEEALRESEQRLRVFFETSNAGMLEIHVGGAITRSNAAFQEMMGCAPGDVLSLKDCLFPEDIPAVKGHWRALKKGHAAQFHGEQRFRRKDGTPLWTLAHVVVLSRDPKGYPLSASAVVVDLTDRKRLEEHLQRAQKMEAVGRLAGGVAHDFNNLLTVINGHTDILLSEGTFHGDDKDSLIAVRDAGLRAARLTSQLLAFSRKAIVEPRVLDLNDIVEVTAKMLRRLLGEDITLSTDLHPELPRVHCDLGQMEQVIMNLAVNARDAMPRGGKLTLTTDAVDVPPGELRDGEEIRPGRYARLQVLDTGSGMTDEVRARIFEPFFTTKEVGRGTGLGLATVYGIVRQASGFVYADSRLGHGTVFTVLLPVVLTPAVSNDPPRSVGRGTETVLLVEDEDAVRKLSRRLLELQGYTVLDAARGADALRLSDAHPGPIALLLTDVVMPQMGGRDLAFALRARRPEIKVLYMSGFTTDAIVRHGVAVATDALIQKPFTPVGLARKIRDVLDERDPSPSG